MKYQSSNIFKIASICLTILFFGLMSTSVTHATDSNVSVNFVSANYQYQDWGHYPLINLSVKYVPLFNDFHSIWKSHNDEIAELIIDNGDTYTLKTGEKLDLGHGYSLKVRQIEINDSGKVWLEFEKDGQYIDGHTISTNTSDNTWTCKLNNILGEDNVPVLKVHVNQVFQGAVDTVAQIDGLWLIDFENVEQLKVGGQYGSFSLNAINNGVDASNLGSLVFIQKSTLTNDQTQTIQINNKSIPIEQLQSKTLEDTNQPSQTMMRLIVRIMLLIQLISIIIMNTKIGRETAIKIYVTIKRHFHFIIESSYFKRYIRFFLSLIIFIIVLNYVIFENEKSVSTSLLNSGNNFWLPSTVMQSVAAIYAVFIAVLVLSLQRNPQKISSVASVLKTPFENTSYIIITVLFVNGLILFSFSNYNLIESKIRVMLIFSIVSLFVSLLAIVTFSFQILTNTAGLKTPEELLVQIEKDEDKLYCMVRRPPDKLADEEITNIEHDRSLLYVNGRTYRLKSYMNSDNYKSEEILEYYVEILNTHENPYIRARTARLFGRVGYIKSVDILNEKLDDYYVIVRQYSAEALGEIGDTKAVEPLIKALTSDNDAGVRWFSARALGKIGDPKAVELLIKYLTDSNEFVRKSVVVALGEIGDTKAVEPLIKALTDNNNAADIRRSVVEALCKIKGAKAVEPLSQVLNNDKDVDVRKLVIDILCEIRDTKSFEALIEAFTNDNSAGDNNAGVRSSIVSALGKLKNRKAVELLNQALNTDSDVSVRLESAKALSEIGDLKAVEPLIKALTVDSNDYVRIHSGNALIIIKGKEWFKRFLSERPDIEDLFIRKKKEHGDIEIKVLFHPDIENLLLQKNRVA